ncbi:MAG: hypothetical protein HY815_34150, partial [Candidatus Riflebacteria bacterium]|nr:hypothetical protein [Candidatus Riflebacteria bacterium]
PMLDRYKKMDQVYGVKYLTAAEREAYRLTIRDGKLYDSAGRLFDTTRGNSVWGNGRAIFVMDEQGNLFASNMHEVGKFHHSSLLAGQPVSAAGELEVRNGVLRRITDQSGHYRPRLPFMEQAVNRLEQLGVDMSTVDRLFAGAI